MYLKHVLSLGLSANPDFRNFIFEKQINNYANGSGRRTVLLILFYHFFSIPLHIPVFNSEACLGDILVVVERKI